ncbi:MAG TPA: hypothetical protein VJ793_09065 [Anaerolineae bacterium]|nr:hypothetical protein [Anaerolineae bacterium]
MATVTKELPPESWTPHATSTPELVVIAGTNYPPVGYAFATGSANETIYARFVANDYGGGNLTVLLDWYSRSGSTTNSVTWGGALSVLTPGDAQSVETDAFATENTQATTVNGTARGLTRTTLTISNLDSLAANDSVEMRIRRTDNSMAGDAILIGVTVQYSN